MKLITSNLIIDMKKNLFSLCMLGIVAMFAACSASSEGYVVTGTFPDSTLNGKTVYILNIDNGQCLDSTIVEGNVFVFQGKSDTAQVAGLSVDGRRSLAVFALENGNITISEENGDSKGTPLNDELTRVSASMDSINTAYYKAYEAFEGSREDWENIYTTEWEPRFKEQVITAYRNHKDDVVGYVLTQFLSILTPAEQLELINEFGPWLSATERVLKTKTTLEAMQRTAVGQPYVDIQGTDIHGNPISLSDFVGKGNYVLVDMWASWCGPCKREIPNLAKLHNLYKNKGLTVLGIYVWDKVENLAPSMEKEKITWPQIIDSNEIATKLYGVQGIPCIMLIGPDGTILDRTNLRGINMQPTVEKFMFGK